MPDIEIQSRTYFYPNAMAREPVTAADGKGIEAIVVRPSAGPVLVLLRDLAEQNPGASLTNVVERVVSRVAHDLVWPLGLDPAEADWVECDSVGEFDRILPERWDARGDCTGVSWAPLGRRNLESFLSAFPETAAAAWETRP